MKRRLLALTLTLCLLLSLLPMTTFATGTYEKATSIAVGDTVVFVCDTKKVELSSFNGTSYAKGTTYTSAVAGTMAFEIVAGATEGTVAFKNNDQYVCWTSSNSLKMNSKLNANSSWVVSFDNSGNAIVLNSADNTRKLQWNASSPRFACYTSSQTAIQLYKLTESSSSTTCEHTNTTTSTEAATCTTAGSTTVTCDSCDAVISTEPINALGHSYNNGICTVCSAEEPKPYYLVTDASKLTAGAKIIIVAADYNYALSTTQNSNNRGQAAVTKNDDESVIFGYDVQVLTLEAGATVGTWAFNTGSGYLYAASSSNNYLKTETQKSANSSWSISMADGVASVIAQGNYSRNTMQYNQSSSLFACYASASQKPLAIYMQGTSSSEPTCAHDYTEEITTAATCTTAGEMTYTCSLCEEGIDGHTKTETISALGHNYANGICTRCQESEPAGTKYKLVTADDVADGNITAGNYVIGALRGESNEDITGVYLATNAITSTSSKDWVVSDTKTPVNSDTIIASDVPADAQVFVLTGDITNGFTVSYQSGNKTLYLGYSLITTSRRLQFSETEVRWTVEKNEKGQVYLLTTSGSDAYAISENLNITTDTNAVIRGYALGAVYGSLYLFREVTTEDVKCNHSWTDANCTTPKTCSVCSATEGEANGHTPSAAATCTTAQTCTVCGAELVTALGHSWTDANCTTPKTCSVCSATEGEANGHTPSAVATCTTAQTCTVCGAELAAALGHKWTDANCTTPKTCSVCSATEGNATGHSYNAVVTSPTCTVAGYTTYTCTCGDNYVADQVTALGHSWTDATCTAPKTCSVCSATEGTAKGHAKVKTEANDPTCTETGNNEYYTCTRTDCGKFYKDSACTQETTVAAETIPATGHTPVAIDVPVCSVCGEGVTPATTVLYVKPNANWHVDNARFAAYFFGNGETWVSAVDTNDDGIYAVEVPAGYPNVIFCRMNPSATANNWNNKWNQTADLTIPTDGTNLYVVKEGTWDNGGGTWIVYPSTDTYTVAGVPGLCGSSWDPADTNNDMIFGTSGVFEKVYENVPAGSYEFKVVQDHAWTSAWPSSNYLLTVKESGSTVTITFEPVSGNVAATVTAPPHTHSYTATVTNPTCTEAGYTTYTCTCGDNYVADQVKALGHSYEDDDRTNDGEWVVETAETCVADGEERLYCTRCNDTNAYQSQVIDEISGHSYTYVADDTANTITETCPLGCNHSATIALKAPENAVYNGSAQEATATVTGTIVAEYGVSHDKQPIDAGTYIATLTVVDKYVSATFTIAKAASTATAPTANTLTYNGEAQALITAGTATGGTMQYKLGDGEWSESIPTAEAAGTYTVYYKVDGGNNYNDVAEQSITVTIGQKDLAGATVTLDKTVFTYDGQSHYPAVTVTLEGFGTLEEGKDYRVLYAAARKTENGKPVQWFGNHTTSDPCIDANNGYYAVIFGLGNFYTEDAFTLYKNFVIEKANPEVTAPTANTLTYNGQPQTLITAGTATGGTVQYSLDGTTWSTELPEATDAGEYTVYYKVVGNNNYNDVAVKEVKVTVTACLHEKAQDDDDCTTAVTCQDCGTETVAAKASHTPAEDDGDCTTAVNCANCSQIATAAKTSHTPEKDDGDCTTAVKCANCDQIATAAKASHTWTDATCTAPKTCSVCGKEEGTPLTAVAKIGTTPYASLQAAMDAAKDGDTVVLQTDVALSKYLAIYTANNGEVTRKITLDLNGKTISPAPDYEPSDYPLVFVGINQTLTVTGGGTITSNQRVTLGVYGTLNLKNTTIVSTGTTEKDAALAVWHWDHDSEGYDGITTGTANITGGTVDGCAYSEGYLTITGGAIDQVVVERGTTIITGGTFSTEVDPAYIAKGYCAKAEGGKYIVGPHADTDPKNNICDHCGISLCETHTWQDATCTTPKTCFACGMIEGEALDHSYTYEVNDTADTITESCSNGCKHSITITLQAPENAVYNASSWAATATATGTVIAKYEISYNKEPINAGTYTATLTVADRSVSVTFEIAKAASTATAPTANTLTYNGKDQALITAGAAAGGTMQYSLDGTIWGTAIPTAKAAGDYTVYYKVFGDTNHEDTQASSLTATIGACTHAGNTNRDDNDCTTEVCCSVCEAVITTAKASHTPETDDGDCTTAVKCANCDRIATAAKASHTPEADDGDCTTAVKCANCDRIATAAKASHTPEADDGDCTTAVKCANCSQIATAAKASHTPETDDGDCTTAVKCASCDQIATAAKASHTPETDDGDCTTAVKCANCDRIATAAKASHTPETDDGDCTTAVKCANCDRIAAAAKASHTPATDDGDCTTAVKCANCDKIATAAKASHTPEADDGDCTTAVKCANCDRIATAAKTSHTPAEDDGNPATAILCTECGKVAIPAKIVLYLKPNANWFQADARFAAYFFGNGETWVDMTDPDGDGIYAVVVPDGYSKVIFCRMNPGTTANNWDNKWNQTADLTVPTDNKNVYDIADGSWDAGQWVTYPEYVYFLRGSMNNWSTSDPMTAKGNGIWTVTMTLAAGNYEYKAGNDDWGLSWPINNATLTLKATSHVTFTLNVWEDTLTVQIVCTHDQTTTKVTATCTQDGARVETCACGEVVSSEPVAAYGHNLEGADHKAPTCTEPGYKSHKCTRCGHTESTDVPELGHAWRDATCSAPKTCANCGETEGTIKNHGWGSIIVVTKPTCTEGGVNKVVCGDCGAVSHLPVAALGHDEIPHEAQAPTCTEKGWDVYVTCSRCNYSTYAEKAALGHNLEGADHKAPTCTEPGYKAHKCTRCDYTETYETSALGHAWVDATCSAPKTCANCGTTEGTIKNHGWGPILVVTKPTCTEGGTNKVVCGDCGAVSHLPVAALGHDKVSHEAKAPTCADKGWAAYETCSRCDYTTYVEIPAAEHTEVPHAAKAPTCTEKGWDAYVTCSECDYSTYVEKAALGHNLEGTDHKAPTCTEPGCKAHKCTRCDYTESIDVPELGHAWVDATCSAPKTCTNCGATEGTIKNHGWGPIIIVKDPTCTEGGVNKVVCGDCGAVSHLPVAALGHDELSHDAKAPTCIEKGWDAYETCSRCDYSTYAEKASLGHDEVSHAAKTPTCNAIGWDAYVTCSRCDYSTYVEKVALGHDEVSHAAKTPTCNAIGWDAYVTCSRCDYSTYAEKAALGHDEVSHEAKAPTCTEKGWDAYVTCSRCDHSTYVEKAALGHDEVSHAAKAPTCTEKGWDAYVTCSRCDHSTYVEKSSMGHDEVSHAAKAPTCTDKGWDAYVTCSRCDYSTYVEKSSLGHDEVSHAAKAPTCTDKGWDAYETCSRCDHSTYVEKAALGHDEVSHEAKAPTCTEKGWDAYVTCSRCDYSTYAEKPATGHAYKAVVTAPTCTAEGYTTYTCACGDSYVVDKVAAKGHTPGAAATCTTAQTCTVCGTELAPAKGHNWLAATCLTPKTCTNCKETVGKPVPHIYSDSLDGTCNVCEIHRDTTEKRTVLHMFRMYDPNSGEHFYTGSEVERGNLIAAGWKYEGIAFSFSETTGAPVYRLYDPVTGEHLYTMDEAEKAKLLSAGWNYEGVAFNSAYDTEVPQYRLFDPKATRGAYMFTGSIEERDFLISIGWVYQGIAFYSSWC